MAVYRDGSLAHLIWYSGVEDFQLDLDRGTSDVGSRLQVLDTIAGPITITGGGIGDELFIEALRGNALVDLRAGGSNHVTLVKAGSLQFL